jgi:hypothetical protein
MNQRSAEVPLPGTPIGLFGCRDGDVIDIPLGLSGLEVFTVMHLLRVGFGYNEGDSYAGTRTFVEDAGYDEASQRYRLRVRAQTAWRTTEGTRTTTNEVVQVMLFRRADFAASSDDRVRLDEPERAEVIGK